MGPQGAAQIRNDDKGKRGVPAESRSPSPDEILQGTREQERGVVADAQYPCDSSSLSSPCSIDADDSFLKEHMGESVGTSQDFDVLSHLLRSRATKLKGQDATMESQVTSREFDMHPTRWKRWPPSRPPSPSKKGSLRDPIHQQCSMPEEMLRMENRGSRDFLRPRHSRKTHLRSVSFPRGREKCADSCFLAASLGSRTTVASSLSDTSLFSFFTRRHTDFSASLRSAETGSFPKTTALVGSKIFQGTHATLEDQPLESVDEVSFNKLRAASLNADVTCWLSRVRSHSPLDYKFSRPPIRGISRSERGSSENFRTVASIKPISQPHYGGFESSGSPRRTPRSELCSATPAEASAPFKYTDTLPLSPSESSSHFGMRSACIPYSHVPLRLSRERLRGPGPTESCTDSAFMVTGEPTSPVYSQPAASTQPCVNLRHASPLLLSRTADGSDPALGKSSDEKQWDVQRTHHCGNRKDRADPEQARLIRELRSETSPQAKVRRCPNAPQLNYKSAPTSDIPELVLGDGFLTPAAIAEGVLVVAKHAEEVGDHGKEKVPLQPALEGYSKPGALEEVIPAPHSAASESDLLQAVRIEYSGPLRQALSAVICRAEATLSATGTAQHREGS